MLAGVAEAEPSRILFGRGGCVEQHDDGTCAVFVRGELLGVYVRDDVASRDVYIAVVMDQASREDVARAFRVSVATVGRVATRKKRGGVRAVADYGRRGGWTVRTPKLLERLKELFEKGLALARRTLRSRSRRVTALFTRCTESGAPGAPRLPRLPAQQSRRSPLSRSS